MSQLLSPRATTIEAHAPKAHALQQEKPQQQAREPQQRVAPARLESGEVEKVTRAATKTQCRQK